MRCNIRTGIWIVPGMMPLACGKKNYGQCLAHLLVELNGNPRVRLSMDCRHSGLWSGPKEMDTRRHQWCPIPTHITEHGLELCILVQLLCNMDALAKHEEVLPGSQWSRRSWHPCCYGGIGETINHCGLLSQRHWQSQEYCSFQTPCHLPLPMLPHITCSPTSTSEEHLSNTHSWPLVRWQVFPPATRDRIKL